MLKLALLFAVALLPSVDAFGLSQCDSNPCQHNGLCVGVEGTRRFHCKCQPHFGGDRCHVNHHCDAHIQPCLNNGHCHIQNTPPYYHCNCGNGYTGYNCQTNACSNQTCHTHGVCRPASNNDGFVCDCYPGFSNTYCQDNNHCKSSPCLHRGTCRTMRRYPFFQCQCQGGYYGDNCQFGHCASNPCFNQGICTNIHTAPYFNCSCKQGFSGALCRVNTHCKPETCKNGGTCYSTSHLPFYRCECLPGYLGQHCAIDVCAGRCQNGGTCRPVDRHPYFRCHCGHEYTGPTCTQKVITLAPTTQTPNAVTQTTSVSVPMTSLASSTQNLKSLQGPVCLSCTDVVSPNTCEYLAYCGEHEMCFVDSYVNSIGSIRYDLGCRDKRLCGTARTREIIGIRDAAVEDQVNKLICTDCCSEGLCNSGGCGAPGFPTFNSGQRGPICSYCNQQNTHDDCNRIQVCGLDQICVLETTSVGTSQQSLYRTGCEPAKNCTKTSFHTDKGTVVCDRKCCAHDLCNNHCQL